MKVICGINVYNDIDIFTCCLHSVYDQVDGIVITEGAAVGGPDGRAVDNNMKVYMTEHRLSVDGTTEFIKSFEDPADKIKYHTYDDVASMLNQKNVGILQLCNATYQYAMQEYGEGFLYLILDSDMVMRPAYVKELKNYLISKGSESHTQVLIPLLEVSFYPHLVATVGSRKVPMCGFAHSGSFLSGWWREFSSNSRKYETVVAPQSLYIHHYSWMRTVNSAKFKSAQLGEGVDIKVKVLEALRQGALEDLDCRARIRGTLAEKDKKWFDDHFLGLKLYNWEALGPHPEEIVKFHPIWPEFEKFFAKHNRQK